MPLIVNGEVIDDAVIRNEEDELRPRLREAMPKEDPIVSFEDGPRLISARKEDVLDGKFILKNVNRESVDFAFVGLPASITRRIPVLPPDHTR